MRARLELCYLGGGEERQRRSVGERERAELGANCNPQRPSRQSGSSLPAPHPRDKKAAAESEACSASLAPGASPLCRGRGGSGGGGEDSGWRGGREFLC